MIRAIGLLALALGASSCSGMRVQSAYDPAHSFAGYSTYAWMDRAVGRDLQSGVAELGPIIVEAAALALEGKGFQKSSAGSADFLVGYHVAVQGRIDVNSVNSYYGYGSATAPWHYPGWSGVAADPYARFFDEGTLIIDVVDAQSRQLVWRGTAQAEVNRTATTEEQDERVREAVRKILREFPPQEAIAIR